MSRKPGRMYTKVTGPAYTRRKYMGGVPGSRITQFDLGNKQGVFNAVVTLELLERCQVRHTALEAARISANRYMHRHMGALGYHLKVRIQPHHVLRENKQATGAGADRVSDGMRSAFGKCVSTCARVKPGQPVMMIRTSKERIPEAKEALRKAGMKLPSPVRIVIEERITHP